MREYWEEAAIKMRSALALLDQSKAPLEVGAQLDFAICTLEEAIRSSAAETAVPKSAIRN